MQFLSHSGYGEVVPEIQNENASVKVFYSETLFHPKSSRSLIMPNNEAAKHHKNASDSFKKAADEYGNAHEHYSSGNTDKGAHHATTGRGHAAQGYEYAKEADKTHAKYHSDNKKNDNK
jgi:hypothetical protein